MKNDPNDRHLDQTDEEILTSDVSDEALEVAAGMGGTGPTASIHPETDLGPPFGRDLPSAFGGPQILWLVRP